MDTNQKQYDQQISIIEQIREWRRQEARDIDTAKAELAQEFGLERNAKFDRAWEIAWSLGHVSGISEVKYYFCELVDLLKP